MKIVAINGSPRKWKGNTERVLKPFLEGASSAGAEVEVIYVKEKNIKPCLGCNSCFLKTPGRCVQKDDMADIIESIRSSDVIVLASPIYVGGVTGQTKTFLDRLTPLSLPFLEVVDGYSVHEKREDFKLRGIAFVSNNGFHELYHFDDLIAHVKSVAKMMQTEFLGAILRPHGVILEMAEKLMPDKTAAVYDAARRAGVELVEKGRVSAELEAEVARELLPRDYFNKAMNDYFRKAWDEAAKGETIN